MKIPKHIAIIMDGNGRWGVKKKGSRTLGHKYGLKTVEKIIKASLKKKIKFLTLYTFSTENWKRPKSEINYLFNLLEFYIDNEINKLQKNGVKINILGDLKKFPKNLRLKLNKTQSLTKNNNKITVNVALNYGSREEIINAMKLLNKKSLKINERNLSKFLYTKNIPDPEILIRTGNVRRLSNFLVWQTIYSEIFFINKLWPDFNEIDLYKIIKDFNKIDRNFGGLNE